jgi:signal transduction histidine kinase
MVVVMLGVLSISGLWGLFSYRDLVNDPAIDDRYSPSAADVIAAVAELKQALPSFNDKVARTIDLRLLAEKVDAAKSRCREFQQRLEDIPIALRRVHQTAWQLIGQLDQGLEQLRHTIRQPRDPAQWNRIPLQVEHLVVAAVDLPDLPDRLRARLREARRDYRSGLVLVSVCSGVVLLLLLGLVRFACRHLLTPISTLHQGARRVAQGDFDYRVPSESNDEMGELAESFNLMTERFQEIASNLDRQVQERSQQLVRSERLASVGFLAAGVAHEINNPLTAISWTAESLESRLTELLKDRAIDADDVAVVEQYIKMIQTESERCQEITKKLLDFSRNHDSAKAQQDVARIIREVLTLITHMRKYRECRLQFEFEDACMVEINGHEIKQVILNLVANALDATAGDGTVNVSIVEHVDEIEVRISDDGCGMSADDIESLFEPFYTTKPTGQGTGLGLSISHRIVTDHGGRIEASSSGVGAGSTFVVRLPRQQVEQPSAAENRFACLAH